MDRIIAVDPGNVQSAFVVWDGAKIHQMGLVPNRDLAIALSGAMGATGHLCIEQIKSYGMAVGETIFRTCEWSGRFAQAWEDAHGKNGALLTIWVPRMDVKTHLCHNSKAKDKNISQALRDRFGEPGTKKAPGVLHGVKKDIWAALAVAVTVWDGA